MAQTQRVSCLFWAVSAKCAVHSGHAVTDGCPRAAETWGRVCDVSAPSHLARRDGAGFRAAFTVPATNVHAANVFFRGLVGAAGYGSQECHTAGRRRAEMGHDEPVRLCAPAIATTRNGRPRAIIASMAGAQISAPPTTHTANSSPGPDSSRSRMCAAALTTSTLSWGASSENRPPLRWRAQSQVLVLTIGRRGRGRSISGPATRRRSAGRITTGVSRDAPASMRHCRMRKCHISGLASRDVRGGASVSSSSVIMLTTDTPMSRGILDGLQTHTSTRTSAGSASAKKARGPLFRGPWLGCGCIPTNLLWVALSACARLARVAFGMASSRERVHTYTRHGAPAAAGQVRFGDPCDEPVYVNCVRMSAASRTHSSDTMSTEDGRLSQIREALAELRGRDTDKFGGYDSDDAPDDVAYPEDFPGCQSDRGPHMSRAVEQSRPAGRAAAGNQKGHLGFTQEELDAMDKEASKAIKRGCKPPSQMVAIVTGLGFAVHKALIPGAEGCVFDCTHPAYPQRVIVKAGWYASTANEARLLRRLQHPSVITILDCHTSSGVVCEVLPKYQSDMYSFLGSLSHALTCDQVRDISRQILSAVKYIHGKRIIHRDIKTENVFVNGPRDVCLGDFGAACGMRGPRDTPFHYGMAGTVDTNAPEMLAGDPYSASVDVWSAGLVIFEVASQSHSLFSAPGRQEMRPCDSQIRRIIKQAQVHREEFPPRHTYPLLSQYQRYAESSTRLPHTRPAWTRSYRLNMDVEYLVCHALTFDGSVRPGAAELLQLPLFQNTRARVA
ncbi:serine/threonine protein kinase US3 [Leporid alphaherpesvirus 4]|uniref:non-specific serine/threonine protein kinase n=1 Tax=Leporid alphaherpesvirus 4 TaxID=481315 RepID=J9QVE3_9ALPH|nr:serine/threonine protein kinase US3 [Leporid alphaherpesvirus 4]AFR32505.1 serine/threonine protein kinase US3 [Leporid alphaherpesvirus 4]